MNLITIAPTTKTYKTAQNARKAAEKIIPESESKNIRVLISGVDELGEMRFTPIFFLNSESLFLAAAIANHKFQVIA